MSTPALVLGGSTPTLAYELSRVATFETQSRRALEGIFETALKPGKVDGVPKLFDFVSPGGSIVGDAKYYAMVGGTGLPPAKFSIIAEHVWLLEKTKAAAQILIFGNDRQVPERWLSRYGHLTDRVSFCFLEAKGAIMHLHGPVLKA